MFTDSVNPFLPAMLAGLVLLAQVPEIGAAELQKLGRTDYMREKDAEPGEGEARELIFRNTLSYEKDFENPDFVSGGESCEAELSLEYTQIDELLRVETLLINNSCGASQGTYTLVVDALDDNDERITQKNKEPWHRLDDADFVGVHEYQLQPDLYISKVRGRLSLSDACECLVSVEKGE